MFARYPKALTSSIKTRLSNSILIGEVIGMLLFGFCIDKFGRRFGVIATTVFLVLVRHEMLSSIYFNQSK
jgi:MFS family permease